MSSSSLPTFRPPLSVLDLAVVNEGSTSAEALARTTAVARRADALGYRRFWVAEHHNMASVASTSPPVLMTHLAASTQHIRVGSGGIMLPNHAPLIVAEHIAAIEALYPGRVDLGLGRAPGSDQQTALAVRRSIDALGADDFPRDLIDLMGLLGDPRGEGGLWQRFTATPVAVSYPEIWLLGSSGYSAQLAGALGLPFAFAHHFDGGGTVEALQLYRRRFSPSPVLDEPHVLVTANVLVAPTQEEADWQSASGRLMIRGVRSGHFERLRSPEEATERLRASDGPSAGRVHLAVRSNRIVGTPEVAVERLEELVDQTGADELMISTVAHDLDVRLRSLELLSDAWSGSGSASPSQASG